MTCIETLSAIYQNSELNFYNSGKTFSLIIQNVQLPRRLES